MQQLDVGMLSVEIFFQMSSFSRWWDPAYIKSSDDETWAGGSNEIVTTSMHCINPCVT